MAEGDSSILKPHPENAPGDFYIENDCCIQCGVMHGEAPDLLGWTCGPQPRHCIVAKQPASPAELEQMLTAMFVSDIDSLRYRGNDPDIIDYIAITGHSASLDSSPEAHGGLTARSHAVFSVKGGWFPVHARTLAESFIRQFTPADASARPERTAEAVAVSHGRATVRLIPTDESLDPCSAAHIG